MPTQLPRIFVQDREYNKKHNKGHKNVKKILQSCMRKVSCVTENITKGQNIYYS